MDGGVAVLVGVLVRVRVGVLAVVLVRVRVAVRVLGGQLHDRPGDATRRCLAAASRQGAREADRADGIRTRLPSGWCAKAVAAWATRRAAGGAARAARVHFGGMRSEPSRRMVSPLR